LDHRCGRRNPILRLIGYFSKLVEQRRQEVSKFIKRNNRTSLPRERCSVEAYDLDKVFRSVRCLSSKDPDGSSKWAEKCRGINQSLALDGDLFYLAKGFEG